MICFKNPLENLNHKSINLFKQYKLKKYDIVILDEVTQRMEEEIQPSDMSKLQDMIIPEKSEMKGRKNHLREELKEIENCRF